jgi:xanthine dehydrogenase accessory factor
MQYHQQKKQCMDNTLAYWGFIRENIDRQVPVMLLYVVESIGSSPGRQGFKMAVNAAGEITGSVGGGIMEYKFVEMAKERLNSENGYISLHKQVHNKEAAKNQSGMICSGEQTLLLYIIQPRDAAHINNIIDCLQHHKTGCLSFSPAGMSFSNLPPSNRYLFSMHAASEWQYEEQAGYKDHLYIIGAGHCGLALSKLMQVMDFYIHLYDERDDLHTLQENSFVHERKMLNGYEETGNYINAGANSYVVVMTSGYRTDDIVIRSLLHKNFKYLAVLGSTKKIEKMFTDYQAEGIDPGILKNIHAPAGLPIKSQTPEEIAISIAAQIIAVKNG